MKTMILAAGRGERLRPLTDQCPKPLIEVQGKPLIVHHIERLKAIGSVEIIINTAYLADKIHGYLGDGAQFGVNIQYSDEPPGALDSGGGVRQALTLLGDEPFRFINADIFTDYPFEKLNISSMMLAHLVLVPNPKYRQSGDFCLKDGLVTGRGEHSHTFSGIGVYNPRLLQNKPTGRYSIVPILEQAMQNRQVSGELYSGLWADIGTPERLRQISQSSF